MSKIYFETEFNQTKVTEMIIATGLFIPCEA